MKIHLYFLGFVSAILLSSCSSFIRHAAVNELGQTFSSEKTLYVISSENDPELIWDSMPLAIKAMEIMLAQDPSNSHLKIALANSYISYAQGHLALQAQMTANTNYNKSKKLSRRAHNLSLRGRDYALSALDSKYPDFSKKVRIDSQSALSELKAEDVPALYWAAAGWAGGIASNLTDMENIAELPVAASIMQKALELDRYYNDGAILEFFIAYEARKPNSTEADKENSIKYLEEVVSYTHGNKAYPYVVYAESAAVKKQDVKLFDETLDKALAVNPNEVMKWRLVNTIAQEKAAWLKTQKELIFIDFEEDKE